MTSQERRRFEILLEHIETQLQQVSEGVTNVYEKLERFEDSVDRRFKAQEILYKGMFKNMSIEIEGVKKDNKVIKADINVIKKDISHMKKKQIIMDEHEIRIGKLEQKMA